jgi:hypothetical protein
MLRGRREVSAACSARARALRQDRSIKLIFLIYFMKNMPAIDAGRSAEHPFEGRAFKVRIDITEKE